jgi:hypothetical protein
MGLQSAIGITESGIPLEQQLAWHFSTNCYPPIPRQMIPTAVEAIQAHLEQEADREISFPEGVSWRGKETASAWQVVESLRLEAWCYGSEEE